MKKVKLLSKVFLSLWIVYNIFTMLVMPNLGSYFGRSTSRFITPYANTVGLNAGWNFFSPDPAHTMYIRYLVHFESDEGETKESVENFFPSEKNQAPPELRKRELYAMRFMVVEPKRLRVLLGPWLCRQYPGASSVDMELVIETVAVLDQAVSRSGLAMYDLSEQLKVIKDSYSCDGSADEEAL